MPVLLAHPDPSDDCGVTGGCGACPLFIANVCGDPTPEPNRCPNCRASLDACNAGGCGQRQEPGWRFDDSAVVEAHIDGLDCGIRPCAQCAPASELTAVVEAVGVLVTPEMPDRDPAEPRPEGFGCCGGNCAA